MAINYDLINKGGISLSANFELLSEKPLDARLVVPTFDGLQNLIDNAAAYEGMVVYVKDQKNHYKVQVSEEGTVSYRELNLTEDELKTLIASETTGSFDAVDEAIKTEVEDRIAAISAEKASREAADAVLTDAVNQEKLRAEAEETRLANLIASTNESFRTDCDTLNANIEAEAATRLSVDQAIQASLNAEITRAEQKEAELNQNLTNSVSTLNQTINDRCTAESLARIAAVDQLTTDLSAANTKLETKLNNETAARRVADDSLTQQIEDEQTARTNAIATLQAELATEAETARTAEESLNNRLTQETQLREAADLATNSLLTAESTAREAGDTVLTEALANKAYELTAAINAEKAAREEAITNVTNDYTAKINQEKSDREAADLAINNKIGGDFNATNTVSKAITDAEYSAKSHAESKASAAETAAKGYAGSIVAIEQSAREAADLTLSGRIDSVSNRVSTLEGDNGAIAVGDAATLASAKAYADGLASNYDAAGSAATAKSEAISTAKGYAKEYTDNEVDKLEAEDLRLAGLIDKNTTAIADEKTTRENAVNDINTKIGTVAEDKNIVTMISEAQAAAEANAATTAQDKVDTLANGQVKTNKEAIATNVSEIARVEGLVNTEKSRAEGIEADFEGRISSMEAFFKGAAADEGEGENLKNALDTLKEIQDFATSEGEAAESMLASIAKNAVDISNLSNDKLDKSTYNTYIDGKSMSDASLKKYAEDEADAAQTAAITEATRLDGVLKSELQKEIDDDVKAAIDAEVLRANTAYDVKDSASTAYTNAVTEASRLDGILKAAIEGTSNDASNIATIAGVKKYAEEKASTAQAAAISTAASDATTKANTAQTNAEAKAASLDTALHTIISKEIDDDVKAVIDVEVIRANAAYEPIGAETRAKGYTDGLVNPLANRVKAIEDAPYATTGNVTDAISTFNTESIVPIINILAGIGGTDEPKTVIEAITKLQNYVDESKINFSIEDETLIIK